MLRSLEALALCQADKGTLPQLLHLSFCIPTINLPLYWPEHTSYNMMIYLNDHNQYGGNFPDFAHNNLGNSTISILKHPDKKNQLENLWPG